MSCREFQNQIVLSLYEELHEGEKQGLEAHLKECQECRQAAEEQQGIHSLLADDRPAWDLPPELLVESRRALSDELDRLEAKKSWWRIPTFSVVLTPMRMLESAALVAMGLALGVYVTNQRDATVTPTPTLESASGIASIPSDSRVSNVRIVNADPATGRVEFAGDVVQPLRFQGRMDDETTQRLLFSAVQDSMNPGSRLQAVEVLARKSSEPSARGVLIHAFLNDMSVGVRLKAFEGLKPLVGDEEVRAAFMQALMNDPNDGVRVKVVDTLAPLANSEAEAQRIERVTRNDDNTYVRLKGQGLVRLVGAGR
jgi:hypothetical protein